MPDPLIEYDTLDQFGWSQKTTYYNNSGSAVSAVQLILDNGTWRESLYDGAGVIYQIHEVDPFGGPDVYDWSERFTYYEAPGLIGARETLYDNGNTKVDLFSGGLLERSEQIDAAHVHGWERIDTYYDFGVRVAMVTTFDDGSLREMLYDDGNGALREIRESDSQLNPDARSWDTINTYFDTVTGKKVAQDTTYDNGTTRLALYDTTGTLMELRQTDPYDNVGWNSINSYYENGQLVFRNTAGDDGVQTENLYDNGRLSQMVQTDVNDTRSFQTITTYFDPTGQRSARLTVDDLGVEKTEQWSDGVLAQISIIDQFDTVSYQSVTTYFDGAGQKASKLVVYDTGLEREETYADGQLQQVQTRDQNDVTSYSSTITTYDANGDIGGRETVYDDGVIRSEAYQAGRLSQITQTDVNNAKSWDSITTYFDASGNRSGAQRIDDNGVTTNDYNLGDGRLLREQIDTFDIATWETKSYLSGDDGNRDSLEVIYDNNDRQIVVYLEDGRAVDYRVDYDGDSSDTWRVRVTEFDAAGANPVVTTYDALYLVPSPYIDALGFVSV